VKPRWEILISQQVQVWLESEPVAVRERVDMVLTVLSAHGPALVGPWSIQSLAPESEISKNLESCRLVKQRYGFCFALPPTELPCC
jgi:hypothetical protein